MPRKSRTICPRTPRGHEDPALSSRTLTNDSLAEAAAFLASKHQILSVSFAKYGLPPMWGRRPGFATLVRIILEQQVSLVSARSMFNRLRQNIDPFTPAGFLEAGDLCL